MVAASERVPRFDALNVHGYWLSHRNDTTDLSVRSKLAADAAGLFYTVGPGTRIIFISAGEIWGPAFPSVAQKMEERLVNNYGIPRERIIVDPRAITTYDEVNLFLQQANARGWNQVADMASWPHLGTISRIYEYNGRPMGRMESNGVDPWPQEDVLRAYGTSYQVQVTNAVDNSRYTRNFKVYEAAKGTVMTMNQDYRLLNKRARGERTQPGHLGLPGLPIDIYKVPFVNFTYAR